MAAPPRRRRRRDVDGLPGHRGAERARRRLGVRHAHPLRRGARPARHRRRAEVRRVAARRALLHAQRRRPHRPRPDRPARRSTSARARSATLAPRAGATTRGLRPRAARGGRHGRRVRREAVGRPDRHEPHQRRRLRPRARGRRPHRARPQRVDRARDLAAASSARGSTASATEDAYWLDIGTPERYLQGTFDIIEGNVQTGGHRAAGRRATWRVGADVERARAHRPAGRRRARAAPSPRAPTSARSSSSATASASAPARRSSARSSSRAPRSARAACCATASSAPASRIGARTHITGGAVIGEGVTVGADNILTRGVRIFPHVEHPRRRHPLLVPGHDRAARATDAIAQVDRTGLLADILSIPEHLRDALWRVESASGLMEELGLARRPHRRGHGRLGDRRRPRARRARRPRLAADRGLARLRPAAVGHAGDHRPLRVLLGQHRGDARLLRGRRLRRRAPRRRDDAAAGWPSWPAPTACRSSRSPAASSRAPRSPT